MTDRTGDEGSGTLGLTFEDNTTLLAVATFRGELKEERPGYPRIKDFMDHLTEPGRSVARCIVDDDSADACTCEDTVRATADAFRTLAAR